MDGCVIVTRPHAAVLLVLVLLAAAEAAAPTTKQQCHSGDRAALVAVKAAFGNASYFVSWTPDIPCCHWFGVRCDASSSSSPTAARRRRVVSLAIMRDAGVRGHIPGAAIAGLAALEELVFLHVPGVSGPIPSSLTRLSALTDLTISRTGVSGPVPSFLRELAALRSLDLSFNSLTGAIPASLAALPNLSAINLGRNRLTGAIPPLFLSNIAAAGGAAEAFLTLSHNDLSGAIPPEFAAVSFVQVDLSRNALAGDASFLFGKGKRLLVAANLSRNALSFDMSTALEFPPRLASLDLSHNRIRGGVPAAAGNLSQLMVFNVSYNRLCGALPAGMASFEVYSFRHNKCLCGAPLPACQA